MDRIIKPKLPHYPSALFSSWPWKMAWRDSRTYRQRLALFLSCILLGVAALVAVRSLGDNLKQAVDDQSRTLLGADLVVNSQRAFTDEVNALIDSIGGEQSREVRFASMAYFPKTDGTRLVQIRALEGNFPYYGTFETTPSQAATTFQKTRTALLDNGLLLQFGIEIGDSVRIGNHTFVIGGRIKKIAGEAMAFSTVAPRVYIPLSDLEKTELIKFGSLANHITYFKLDEGANVNKVEKRFNPYREEHRIRTDIVVRRQQRLNRTLGNLYNFLSLVAFSALLLGCIGVASAIHVYMRQKQTTVAILRCLGAQSGQVLTIYAVQTAALGFIGAFLGAGLGLAIQHILPQVLANFLPVELNVQISWPAILQGMSIGIGLSLLFALLPLLPVRHTSPLRTLRASFEEVRNRIDRLQAATFILIILFIAILSILQTNSIGLGLGITAGFFVAFGLLIGAANLIMKTVKRFFPTSWQYVWRQGLANLYRPNNQTSILMLALGLGTFLIATLYIVHYALINHVAIAGGDNRPNLVLIDVQTDQQQGVANIIQAQNLPIIHQAPVVTMRLSHVKGYPVDVYRKQFKISRWSLFREYRSTYRNHIYDSETIISGTWHNDTWDGNEPVPISLEEGIAKNLKATLGDTLTFNVQGVPIVATIQSLREVDWQRIQPNFFVVFPTGVLEPAPQFHVFTTRVTSTEQSAKLQRELVKTYPNVSAADLGLILQTVDDVLSQVSFVVRFMALFCVFTGLIVLASAVTTSRYQRVQEAVLLRTLGASKRQIRRILFLEYLFLGTLAAFTGLLLSIGGAWALSFFVFNIGFALPYAAIIGVFVLVTLLTVCVGMLNSRGIADRPPLEILRAEG
jgi:putative ABC transport system permease protein